MSVHDEVGKSTLTKALAEKVINLYLYINFVLSLKLLAC